MKPLKIIKYPNPILRKKASTIRAETDWEEIKILSEKMHRTMHFYEGIGLAAPQVGVNLRMFVMQIGTNEGITFINPEIIELDNKEMFEFQEGCLSFPFARGWVTRPRRVKVRYTDLDKKEQTKIFEGLEAICVQHEIDHLSGILFIDHISNLQKEILLKKLKKRGFI